MKALLLLFSLGLANPLLAQSPEGIKLSGEQSWKFENQVSWQSTQKAPATSPVGIFPGRRNPWPLAEKISLNLASGDRYVLRIYFPPSWISGTSGKYPTVLMTPLWDSAYLTRKEDGWCREITLKGFACAALQEEVSWHLSLSNPEQSIASFKQGVESGVRATRAGLDYLSQRPDIDADRIALLGSSLGGFVAALVAEEYPQAPIRSLILVLVGGGYSDIISHSHYRYIKDFYVKLKTQLGFQNDADLNQWIDEQLKPIEPLDNVASLGKYPIIMFGLSEDEIIPPATTQHLLHEMQNHGANVRFVEFQGKGHDPYSLNPIPRTKLKFELVPAVNSFLKATLH